MTQPSKDILVTNRIILSKGTNKPYCTLCMYACSNKLLKHIEMPSHVRRLEKFNSIFDTLKTSLRCKICGINLNWTLLERHAIEHKIAPWYKPEDRYKIFFENQTLQWENRFYCYPCDRVFLYWSSAFDHMDKERHKKLLKAQELDDNTFAYSGSSKTYKTLVHGGFIPWKNKSIACKICKCFYLGIHGVGNHIAESRHRDSRFKLIEDLKDRVDRKTVAKKMSDNDIKLTKGNNYWCGFCKSALAGLEQVLLHITEDRHMDSRWGLTANGEGTKFLDEPIRKEIRKEPVDAATSDRGSLLPDYIIQDSDTRFYCIICDGTIINRVRIEGHVARNPHANARKNLDDNKITFKGENNYRCGFCNCKISSFKDISVHMGGYKHASSRSNLTANGTDSKMKNEPTENKRVKNKPIENEPIKNEPIKTEQIKIGTIKQPIDGDSDRGSSLPDYIIQDSDTRFYCIICDGTIINRVRIEGHVTRNPHAKARKNLDDNKITFKGENNYHCGFCNCKISSFKDISVHMGGYKHASSRSNLTANGTDSKMKNEPTENKRVKNKPIENEPIENEPIKTEQIKIGTIKQPIDGDSDRGSSLPDYIVKNSGTDFHCTICNLIIDNRDYIKRHLETKQHSKRREKCIRNKISLKGANSWHCGYCNYEFHGWNKVFCHIYERTHKDLRSDFRANATESISINEPINHETIKQPSDYKICNRDNIEGHISGKKDARVEKILDEKTTRQVPQLKDLKPREPSEQNLSHGFLVKIDYTDWFCAICNCMVYGGQRNTNDHLAGSAHAMALKKYGCDNISLVPASQDYYCRSCDCRIRGTESLWRHALGEEHAASANLENDQVTGEKKIPDDPKTLKRPNKVSKGPMKFKEFPCTRRLGPVNNSRRSFVSKIWKQQIRDSEGLVCCNICGVKLANVVEFHSHLAGHFSKDFVRSSKEEGRNIEENNEEENRRLARALNLSTESIYTLASDGENCDSSETPGLRVNKEDGEPGRLERTPKKPNMERILRALNFENDEIYSMKDKLRELELGMKLSRSSYSQRTIYCLVCQLMTENTVENYFEHLCSLHHCVLLEKMERDHALYEKFPEQFSAIDLGLQCMEAITGDLVLCRACDEEINDDDEALRDHIDGSSHAQACRMIRIVQMRSLDLVKLPMQCDWYKVKTYRCVPCLLTFNSEVNFVTHLASKGHLYIMERPVNTKRRLIFDFCEACALLWYGYRRTCAYHRNIETHVWLIRDGHYVAAELPRQARDLLAMPERYINETIERYAGESASERDKERTLIRDLEGAVRWKYDRAKAHVFGSRVTGVGSSESDIDVFLDCGDTYDGKLSRDTILKFMDVVFECLNQDPHSWVVEELVKMCRAPIIKVHHRPTGLSCDITFANGLAVDKTLLIKSFIDVFPLCREMIIFLKRWTTLCELSGSALITSHAVYWHVMFYLQRESILPSVAKLIAMKNESHKIAGWEVGVARDFTCNEARINFRIRELLAGFFTFWSNFDHRYDVACPIIGKILKKRTFVDPTDLPKDMEPYVDCMRISSNQEPIKIGSPMCIQDPFDLQCNITGSLSKVYVNRFRKYCSMSSDILNS